jgi:hypothetical protein
MDGAGHSRKRSGDVRQDSRGPRYESGAAMKLCLNRGRCPKQKSVRRGGSGPLFVTCGIPAVDHGRPASPQSRGKIRKARTAGEMVEAERCRYMGCCSDFVVARSPQSGTHDGRFRVVFLEWVARSWYISASCAVPETRATRANRTCVNH